MNRAWHVLILAPALAAAGPAADVPTAPAAVAPGLADFKLVIQEFGVRETPVSSAQLIVREGIGYLFVAEEPEEVVVIDPVRGRLSLLDLERRNQTEVSAHELDAGLGRRRRTVLAAVARLETAGGKANQVAAAMSRNLIDPRFVERFDPDAHRLRLTNANVEIEALGVPDPDRARRLMIVNALAAILKLDALRAPDDPPPFARLDVLRALGETRRLRPAEIAVVYRLTGPPRKLRWTYQLIPSLTAREREAIARLAHVRVEARFVSFENYEAAD